MTPTRGLTLLALVSLTLLVACGPANVTPAIERYLASIVAAPDTVLLTGIGDSATLVAEGFDGDGEPLAIEATWESLTPDTLEVSGDGTVTSLGSLGSGQVIARADGVASAPVFVLLAQPMDWAVLIDGGSTVRPSKR
jgi:hypothetical protein